MVFTKGTGDMADQNSPWGGRNSPHEEDAYRLRKRERSKSRHTARGPAVGRNLERFFCLLESK